MRTRATNRGRTRLLDLVAGALMTSRLGCAFVVVGLLALAKLSKPRPRAALLPVVPGGEGFGMETRAAYGGPTPPVILRVTNLNDSGAGSLRDALALPMPRVVIFETSGTIAAQSDYVVTNPYLTVAGQTAPSPGITVRNFGIQPYTHDVLLQHLRIRPGDGPPLIPATQDHDGSIAYDAHVTRVVYDHCSLSWAGGKNAAAFSIGQNGTVCYWRNFISEGLYWPKNIQPEPGQPGSLGLLVSQAYVNRPASISVLGNLLAHNADRNPEIQGPVSVQFVNNVVYDWGHDTTPYPWATFIPTYMATGVPRVALVGNAYLPGPAAPPFPLVAVGEWNNVDGTQIYLLDNLVDQSLHPVTLYDPHGGDHRVSSSPVPLDGLTLRPSSAVQAFVLANAGARPMDRDDVDRRLVADVTNKTGGMITSQDEVGGWPALAVKTRSLTTPSNPHAVQASGYTALEEWLHGYARAVEGTGVTLPTAEAIAFDYTEADLATYQVSHFEGAWDSGAFQPLTAETTTLPDTPDGSLSYRVVPPFTAGAHTLRVKACNAGGCGEPTAPLAFQVTVAPVPPDHLRPVD